MRRLFIARIPLDASGLDTIFVSDKPVKLGHPTGTRPGFIHSTETKQGTTNMAFVNPTDELAAVIPPNVGAIAEVHLSPIDNGIEVDYIKSDYCSVGWAKVTGTTNRRVWLRLIKRERSPVPLSY